MRRQTMPKGEAADALAVALAALPDLPLDELRDRWLTHFGVPPPSRLGRKLLVRAIAHKTQERVLGGLDQVTLRWLMRASERVKERRTPASRPSAIKPGTRLLREWHGVIHEIVVLEDGVQYRGKTWASLSAVAHEITGTRWSGPLFFGLKGRGHGSR